MALILLLSIVYIIFVSDKLWPYLEVCSAIRKLRNFVNAYSQKPDCRKELDSLLRYYPIIRKYETRYSLSYSKTAFGNEWNAERMLPELMMLRNEKAIILRRAANPLHVLKRVLLFPSETLSSRSQKRGTSEKKAVGLALDFIWWTAVVLASHLLEIAFDSYLFPWITSICQNNPK